MRYLIIVCTVVTVDSEIVEGFYFHKTSHMRSFVKIKSLRNGEITLLFTYIGKSGPCREFQRLKYVF